MPAGKHPADDDVVHEKNGAHEAATIHPFGGSASPKIRDAHHAMRRSYNAGCVLLQGCPPFLLRHRDGFGDISLAAVGISHLIKGTFVPPTSGGFRQQHQRRSAMPGWAVSRQSHNAKSPTIFSALFQAVSSSRVTGCMPTRCTHAM
mgnify:CR=1 FL=1